jgi:hypothetical protein
MSVANELEHAERVVEDVALLQDIAAGKLGERRLREAADILLEHRLNELPSVSVAVAARLLDVSRTTVEAWRSADVLTPAAKHQRHEVTIESLVRLQALTSELKRLGRVRQLRDYVWWSAQDSADYANGQLSEALRQLRAVELAGEYAPSEEDLEQARHELANDPVQGEMPVKPDARTVLGSLVGKPISTVTGRMNTVLRLEGDNAIVATSRSPGGQPVPIAWVQSGLERLLTTGEIEVSVPSLGYRSAFIGAVLLSLPGAVLIQATPPRVRLTDCGLWTGSGASGRTDGRGRAGPVTSDGGVVKERLAKADGLREVAARGGWRTHPAGVLVPCCPARLGSTGSSPGVGAMQMLGSSPGGRCLRRVLLSLAKLSHRGGQVEEIGHQDGDGERAVATDVAEQREQRPPARAR